MLNAKKNNSDQQPIGIMLGGDVLAIFPTTDNRQRVVYSMPEPVTPQNKSKK